MRAVARRTPPVPTRSSSPGTTRRGSCPRRSRSRRRSGSRRRRCRKVSFAAESRVPATSVVPERSGFSTREVLEAVRAGIRVEVRRRVVRGHARLSRGRFRGPHSRRSSCSGSCSSTTRFPRPRRRTTVHGDDVGRGGPDPTDDGVARPFADSRLVELDPRAGIRHCRGPLMSVPMKFASIVLPSATEPAPGEVDPGAAVPGDHVASAGVDPADDVAVRRPTRSRCRPSSLQTAAVPAALVPIRLPRMMLPFPLNKIPFAPFPEMRLP